jgi:general nucleoside transport system ATP-binding protein
MDRAQPSPGQPDRLKLRGIRKAYPSVVANDDLGLRVAAGEIHAVVGENGAGKSTLMKIIYGVVQPDEDEMPWNGKEVVISSPAEAGQLGIGMVFQHFALFDTLTVAENIALAMPGDRRIWCRFNCRNDHGDGAVQYTHRPPTACSYKSGDDAL